MGGGRGGGNDQGRRSGSGGWKVPDLCFTHSLLPSLLPSYSILLCLSVSSRFAYICSSPTLLPSFLNMTVCLSLNLSKSLISPIFFSFYLSLLQYLRNVESQLQRRPNNVFFFTLFFTLWFDLLFLFVCVLSSLPLCLDEHCDLLPCLQSFVSTSFQFLSSVSSRSFSLPSSPSHCCFTSLPHSCFSAFLPSFLPLYHTPSCLSPTYLLLYFSLSLSVPHLSPPPPSNETESKNYAKLKLFVYRIDQ